MRREALRKGWEAILYSYVGGDGGRLRNGRFVKEEGMRGTGKDENKEAGQGGGKLRSEV